MNYITANAWTCLVVLTLIAITVDVVGASLISGKLVRFPSRAVGCLLGLMLISFGIAVFSMAVVGESGAIDQVCVVRSIARGDACTVQTVVFGQRYTRVVVTDGRHIAIFTVHPDEKVWCGQIINSDTADRLWRL